MRIAFSTGAIEIDPESTRDAYRSLDQGVDSACCNSCATFNLLLENDQLPGRLVDLLKEVGADPKKPDKVWGAPDSGFLAGWWNLFGRIVEFSQGKATERLRENPGDGWELVIEAGDVSPPGPFAGPDVLSLSFYVRDEKLKAIERLAWPTNPIRNRIERSTSRKVRGLKPSEIRELLTRMDRADVQFEKLMGVHRSRVEGWTRGRRVPRLRQAQLEAMRTFTAALEYARSVSAPPCEHHFEPIQSILGHQPRPPEYVEKARVATQHVIEQTCAPCAARQEIFDERFGIGFDMPSAPPPSFVYLALIGATLPVLAIVLFMGSTELIPPSARRVVSIAAMFLFIPAFRLARAISFRLFGVPRWGVGRKR